MGSRFLLPLIVGFIQVVGTSFASHDQPDKRALDALAIVLLVAGPLALTQRKRYTAPVLIAVLTISVAYHLFDYPDGPIFVSLVVAFISASVRGYRALAWSVVAAGYVGFVWGHYLLGTGPAPGFGEALGVAAWLLALVGFSEMGRGRRESAIEASRTRREERKRREIEERLRIARELHDVLAHNISLINVQAGVALHLLDEKPEGARPALAAIKDASNEALGELRSVLDILRRGAEDAPLSPAARLDDLDALVERNRSAGLDVRLELVGDRRPLPPNLERAAFRICQEAITNVTRHAGGAASARIRLEYQPDALVIDIEDNGSGKGSANPGGGNGIPGMRERATALGGSLEAGPGPTGGFRVSARLPTSESQEGAGA